MVKPMDEFYAGCLIEEYHKARKKHRRLASAHEGYAVILEELEEAWDAIKKDDKEQARKEIYQVGAMCLAFLLEIE